MTMSSEERKVLGKHGIEGGAPPQFPPCGYHKPYTTSTGKIKIRHRFERGVCKCGIVNAPGLYRFEDSNDQRTWYVRDGKNWVKIAK